MKSLRSVVAAGIGVAALVAVAASGTMAQAEPANSGVPRQEPLKSEKVESTKQVTSAMGSVWGGRTWWCGVHGTRDLWLSIPETGIQSSSAITMSFTERGGGGVDFNGDATITVQNVAIHANGSVYVRVNIAWGSDLCINGKWVAVI
ncbi:hypothetical protein Lesp02_09640 [Lentzea sp. NBRC 105346]|uniref:hypothetical protein n=1 Tax=Lentzea sp. NBRC 105346 TaxID=3032205 RepID=UPI0024A04301|nr:hypothetical protein [Lentzea sp. NBRC 105346]GLZ28774.1 hypothetical protein Lesp02_09640 [Lentzea sp. NBRC 105346]